MRACVCVCVRACVLQAEGSRLKYGQVTCRAKGLSNINIVAPADATPLTVLLTFEARPRKRASALSKVL